MGLTRVVLHPTTPWVMSDWKSDWGSYVAPLVHTYNCTKHETTLFTDIIFKRRGGYYSMALLYIGFTYQTEDNQQGWFRLCNWFFLPSLEPWMKHLPPVWGSLLGLYLQNNSWCVSLVLWRGLFYWFLAFVHVFIHYLSFAYHFSCLFVYYEITFYIKYFYCHIPYT